MFIRLLLTLLLLSLVSCSSDEDRLKIKRDIANLQEQIYELERNQAQLNSDVRRTLDGLNARIEDRSSQADLQDQLSSLRETLSQFEARVQDLDDKVADLRKTKSQVATAPIQPVEGQELAPIENVSGEVVEQQFNQALLDFNHGKFPVAVLGFQGVLENFPNSPYTEASHYYLGRCYTETKQYQKAGETFRTITSLFPQGDFIKQAMYYEGQCYYYLNQYSKAVLTLQDLIERFPGTQESALAKQFLKKAGYEK